jgi:hypothetical protein
MIADKDRSGWFGGSDTDYIVGNWNTKSFLKWWLIKIGVHKSDFESLAMNAGTHKEHQILEYIGVTETDKQILIPEIKLRVNLDGNTHDTIHEVKTHSADKPFKCPIKYKRQVWVQMYASKLKKAFVDAYALTEADYKNYLLPIDGKRLTQVPIEYNEEFIGEVFLPRIRYLAWCLEQGLLPDKNEFERGNWNDIFANGENI